MRREGELLLDIVEACDSIEAFLKAGTAAEFHGDELVKSAVLQKLLVIGEAAAQLGRPFHERHPDVPWSDVVGFRNLIVHAYFQVDWSIVWTTATVEVPDLRRRILKILEGTP